jgi:hypothetical protein
MLLNAPILAQILILILNTYIKFCNLTSHNHFLNHETNCMSDIVGQVRQPCDS